MQAKATQRLVVLLGHLQAPGGAMGSSASISATANVVHSEPAPEREDLATFRKRTTSEQPGSPKIQGINHLALVCSDMERTVKFWTELMGLRLVKTIDIGNSGQHFFFDMGGNSTLAYFWWPKQVPAKPGVASVDPKALMSGKGFTTANGSMNHVAFNVGSKESVKAYRKRLQAAGVLVSPVVKHADNPKNELEFYSIYFWGPDGEYLELTSQERTFNADDVAHLPRTGQEATVVGEGEEADNGVKADLVGIE
eukprot:TRINITY_DN21851_c1_g6_i1.p1 TRINITY_DN21851_c1_g6~~TRINITY_DN21851_c1_g6_i1.p1  ORF type:complete len:253 (-),score=73.80 TRINITY_DN21851_c1_g6_i1:317-1075(-)